jgi:diguanylate cyclase (GGDEF)-like protein
MLATRFSNSFCVPATLPSSAGGLLVKIHPASPLDRPLELLSETSIGRDESSSLALEQDSISRRHALIEHRNGEFFLRDLGSTNGTFVNEVRVNSSVSLSPGDRIRFGDQIFKFLTTDGIESQYHEVIFKMMTTDGLTQVYNKRFFLDSLDREIRQSQRGKQSICVMMLDLDKFKSVNDTYGHLAGDAVLAEFAKRASSVLRGGELLARYGGEEFSILCAPATLEQAKLAAERVRAITASAPVITESVEIPMTVSIGMACYCGDGELDAKDLLGQADAQLYRAKQNGRNQVQFAT